MDSILKIINYLFKKSNIGITADNFDSFFSDGVSFPKFVSLALNVESIPNVKIDPTTSFHIEHNNDLALQFLFDKNKDIERIRPSYNSVKDKANLLSVILTKQFFKINYQEIINKCNLILSNIGIIITKESELIDQKCIQSLFYVLTDGVVQIDDKTKDFNQLMTNFEKAQVPLVIDESSLDVQNQFTFFIQILIIFDCFSDKIALISESQNQKDQKELRKHKEVEEQGETAKGEDFGKKKEVKKLKGKEKKKETKKQKETENQNDEELQNNNEKNAHKKIHKSTIKKQQKNDQFQLLDDDEIEEKEVKATFDLYHDEIIDDDHVGINNENKNVLFDELNDIPLLKTINIIAAYGSIHFNNFHQTIEKDNLLKFVRILLRDGNDVRALSSIISQIKPPEYKIREMIKYISEKREQNEPVFNVLALNFKEKKFSLSSASLFYTNFLNIYFLKDTKLNLFSRLSTIIFGQITEGDFFYPTYMKNMDNKSNPYEDLSILLQWDTYLALVNFINTKKTHYIPDPTKNDESYFKENRIPQVIDRDYLSHFTNRVPDAAFYQLQFIFDTLDNKKYHVLEIILKTERIIKEIKIPKYHTIAASIKSKYFSIIFQKENYEESIKRKKEKKKEAEKPKEPEIKKEKKEIVKPETFKQRLIKRSRHLKESLKSKRINLSLYLTTESFWNPFSKKSLCDNGVLCSNENNIQSNDIYFDDLEYYNNYKTQYLSNDESVMLFKDIPILEKKSDLYKFFIYNEKSKKWEMDKECIKSFFSKKQFDFFNPTTPLILFLNSDEEDVISINSKFGQLSYPEIDPECGDIFVYATSERDLPFLSYNLKSSFTKDNFNEKNKPIFLCLHVPKCKSEYCNIRSIIFKIYYFLSIISDIKIVILNKEHLLEQIELVKRIENIKRSYEVSANRKLEIKSPNRLSFSEKSQEVTPKKIKKNRISKTFKIKNNDDNKNNDDENDNNDKKNDDKNDDYDVYSSDDDDNNINDNDEEEDFIINEINDEFNEEEEEENTHLLNNAIDDADLDVWKKKAQYIFLISDGTVYDDMNEPGEIRLFLNIKEEISNATIEFYHINANDPITYRGFLTSLTSLSKEVTFKSNDVKKQLNLYPLTEISNMYIELKSKDEWKAELKEIINKRFMQLKDKDKGLSSELYVLSKLDNELSKSYPSIDSDFSAESAKILKEISNSIVEKNQNTILTELEESSNNNLRYLSDIITSKDYFSDKEIDIEISHINFLKNEYFQIIHESFPKKDQIQVFEGNRKILEDQIKKDVEKIKQIINDFNDHVKSLKEQKTVSWTDKAKSGTNYTIRETENVREIQVLVQAGHLNDVIEQDF